MEDKTFFNLLENYRRFIKFSYEDIKKIAYKYYKKNDLDEALKNAAIAATLAYMYHIGYWYDDDLEFFLKKISDKIFNKITLEIKKEDNGLNENTTLFLTSFILEKGGHSRVMKLWIDCLADVFENIYLISTEFFLKTPNRRYNLHPKVKYFKLKSNNFTEKIKELANLVVKIRPKNLVLFVHPNDIIPVATLGYLKNLLKFKVTYFEYSDHTFWLGKSIIDILVGFRKKSEVIARTLRNFKGNVKSVPLGTPILTEDIVQEETELQDLKKLKYSTVSLSVGSPWKFVADKYWNYFKTIEKILYRNKNHMHILITMPHPYIEKHYNNLPREIKSRFKIIYNNFYPKSFYRLADFVIGSFPIGGGVAKFDVMALGIPTIFVDNKESILFSYVDFLPASYKYVAQNEDDIIRYAEIFIKNKEERERAGRLLKRHFDKFFEFSKLCKIIRSLFEEKETSNKYNEKLEKKYEITVNELYLFYHDIKAFASVYLPLFSIKPKDIKHISKYCLLEFILKSLTYLQDYFEI